MLHDPKSFSNMSTRHPSPMLPAAQDPVGDARLRVGEVKRDHHAEGPHFHASSACSSHHARHPPTEGGVRGSTTLSKCTARCGRYERFANISTPKMRSRTA